MRRVAGVALVIGWMVAGPTARAQQTAEAQIRDNFFTPFEVHVAVGDSVVWRSLGDQHHTVSADDGSFESSPDCTGSGPIVPLPGADDPCVNNGESFSHQFTISGTFPYHCRIHPDMSGRVVVTPAATSTTTTTSNASSSSTSSNGSDSTTTSSSIPASDQPTVTQGQPPDIGSPTTGASRGVRLRVKDDPSEGPLALVAIVLAAGTTIAGIVLVRKGRVPFG